MKPNIWIRDFMALFYPALCVSCADALIGNEQFLCSECLQKLPKTNHWQQPKNTSYNQLAGKIPIQKAAAWLYYNKGGIAQRSIAEIKYRGNRAFGQWIGSRLAEESAFSGFFDDIDLLIPVPLHSKRLRKRGFNQTEIIAQGISKITHIPIDTKHLYRGKANETQTKKSLYERWRNTQSIFQIRRAEELKGKHLLLIDDVLTTGSTLEACGRALLECPEVQISVLTVAIT